ncbi:MAG TPA: glycoside hydrolase family 108 protein [Scandinavium sp.]|jgi:lysozyme family protein|uniref:glycoside hydrolase family 108 protein n=1 Tax=Scandinavium sp. TaxID=2830653 RepID=UPI002E34B40A|nr:glycoside hydrolase family 108 protein [Scandinavium sp.]HEX4499684.1 glycoside hydrolase family 108 protein [Scandinavium sp.]
MNPVLDGILEKEGGYTDNPADKGGPTNWGITEATARTHGYQGEMRNLTRDEAYAILEESYWTAPGFDQIAQLSLPIAFELCDAGVNVGPGWPSRWLQRWLNAFNLHGGKYEDLRIDGKIGGKTLIALRSFLAWRGKEGEQVLMRALNCSQGEYYLEITESREKNEEFIYGWIKNRVIID